MNDNDQPDNQGQGSQTPDTTPNVEQEPSEKYVARLHGVSKRFGPLRVLHRINLEFERGKTTVILGPSGTGKSVLIKHIVGLLKPDQGEVYFNDVRVDQADEQTLVEMRKKIGFLFQMGALFDSMNVGDNVAFPLVEHTKASPKERAERVSQVLRQVGLGGLEHKMPAQLSGGQRKRVALARAIVLEPELILYDEPTTGLDPIRSDVINELIIALNKELGISSIVVTHDMASANKVADRMLLLYNGSIVCDGTPEEFRRSDNELVQRFIKGIADEQDLDSIRSGFDKDKEGQRSAAQEPPKLWPPKQNSQPSENTDNNNLTNNDNNQQPEQ
ncbi:ABC transporter ATP-binding protein [Planctomycetota bacterium]|nr:ABC transporter ATP-binding protein [Planctomycetota bacterium]